ncbi:MAG: hypothetical protein GC203_21045 [Phenylobacterium sp.]|uniref:hypothetical protein n=1 Tax=Phenylobacterium sp. TaxID=1871053 RepID=UPI0025FFEDD6|nr:hypothetical protein [Phenylobacterium sp.]MBI1200354.1 hypothetical protein [Phenylobacterium sp.]
MHGPTPYQLRCARLEASAPPWTGWQARSCGDAAATLRALGVAADGSRRLLDQMAAWRSDAQPAALSDLCDDFRIGVMPVDEAGRFSGRPIGVCGRFAILVWPKTEADMRRP